MGINSANTMKGLLSNVLFTVVLFCLRLSTAEEDRFFWSAEFISKPNNFYHGAPIQIPAIEGEELDIQCQVRAVSEDTYTIIWDYEGFNATTSGMTDLVNNTAGDEFAVDTIKVNITNPAIIDDKDIICSWENGQFSDTISLQFKVYVEDKSSPGSCPDCRGTGHVKLVRPGKQKKEDANMEEMIREKVKKTYGLSRVFIESDGSVCGCKPHYEPSVKPPMKPTMKTTTKPTIKSTIKSTIKTTKKPPFKMPGWRECQAINRRATNEWCNNNCNSPQPNCLPSWCSCSP